MASLSAAPSFTGAKSAMRHTEPSGTFARPRIAPLRRGAFVSRRTAGTTRAAAGGPNGTPNKWAPSPNARASPYTAPSGRDMPRERDMYEGTTGLDVLAMQKDLVAEGFLGRQYATGCVPNRPESVPRFPRLAKDPLPRPTRAPPPRTAPPRPPRGRPSSQTTSFDRWTVRS